MNKSLLPLLCGLSVCFTARAAAQLTETVTAAIIAEKIERHEQIKQGEAANKLPVKPGDESFQRINPKQTGKVVLLMHGLTDSPYYVRELADIFFANGYSVEAILLPGHGKDPKALFNIELKDWRQAVAQGLEEARRLDPHMTQLDLAGFSTGGALALDALVQPDEAGGKLLSSVGNVLLFSPAIRLNKQTWEEDDECSTILSGAVSAFKPWAPTSNPNAVENDPYRYRKTASFGGCQLIQLIDQNVSKHRAIMTALNGGAHNRPIGVFAVESLADTTVDPSAVVEFMSAWPDDPRHKSIFYPKADGIAHADVPRATVDHGSCAGCVPPGGNPHFNDPDPNYGVKAALNRFLNPTAPRAPGNQAQNVKHAQDVLNSAPPSIGEMR